MKKKLLSLVLCLVMITAILPLSASASPSAVFSGFTECTVPGCTPSKIQLAGNDGSPIDNPLQYSTCIVVPQKGQIHTYYLEFGEIVRSECAHGVFYTECKSTMFANYNPTLIGIPQIVTLKYHNKSQSIKVMNTLPAPHYTDVPSNAWYHTYVYSVARRGIMTGLNSTTFAPEDYLYRAQFAVSLHRMAGEPYAYYDNRFPDVAQGQWYTTAIAWASQAGIITGYTSNGYFGVNDPINREQTALMLYRFAKHQGYDTSKRGSLSGYPDAGNVSSFAKEGMEWAVGNGIITGDNGRLNPQNNLNRAEAATVITRFMEKYIG